MITDQLRTVDQYDVAALFAAIVRLEDDPEIVAADLSMVQVGYDELLLRCRIAAAVLARDHLHDAEGWDGVVWFEQLEQGALAYQLFTLGDVQGQDRIDAVERVTRELIKVQQGHVLMRESDLPAY